MNEAPTTARSEVRWNLILELSGLGFMVTQGIVLVPLYLKFIGAAEFGVWLVASAVAAWIAVIDPGLSGLIQQRVSLAIGADKLAEAFDVAVRGMRLTAVAAVVVLCVGTALSYFLVSMVDSSAVVPVVVGWWLVFLSVAAIALGMVASGITAVGIALRCARSHTVVSLSATALSIVATVIMIFAGVGVLSLPIGMLVRGVAQAGIGYVLVRRKLVSFPASEASVPAKNDFGFAGGLLRWSWFEKIVGTLAASVGVFLVGRCFDSVAVTSYVITRRPVDMVSTLLLRSSGALIPTVTYLAGKRADSDLSGLVVNACSRIVWLLSFACLGTVIFLEPIIGLWVGRQHYMGEQIGVMLALGLAVQVFAGAFSNFLWASGEAQVFLKLNVLLNVLIVVGMVAGIYFGGVLGMIVGALMPRLMLGVWLLPKLALAALRVTPADRAAIWRELAHAVAALATGLLIFLMLERARPAVIFNGLVALVGAMAALGLFSFRLRCDLGKAVGWSPRCSSQHQ